MFYDKLYVPSGIALGGGGAYVANQPDLLFLEDTDGDLEADVRRILLSGFGTEDNHHAISAWTWGPGGWLYFQEGLFMHASIETPRGCRTWSSWESTWPSWRTWGRSGRRGT